MTAIRPNILFIMADQFRADAIGSSAGNGGWTQTPALDRLCREGVVFSDCSTNAPVCMPARFALATGRSPHAMGLWSNARVSLAPNAPTWMAAVRAAGYRTSLIGKTHFYAHDGDLRAREPLLHGWGLDDVDEIGGPHASMQVLSHVTQRWQDLGWWEAYRQDYTTRKQKPWVARPSPLPAEEHLDGYVGRRAVEWLERAPATPWMCWVSFGGPHEPFDAPVGYHDRHRPEDMPAPRSAPDEPWPRAQGEYDRRRTARPRFDDGDVAALRANYAGKVELIDEWIGRMIAVLEQRGTLSSTVIVFTSDHGEMNGDAGLLEKFVFLDAALRVPLIVRLPDGPRGTTNTNAIELMDVGATLADLAGAQPVVGSTARSLRPLLDATVMSDDWDALSCVFGECALITSRWKLVLNSHGDPYLLFDRRTDPHEQRNVVGDPAHAEVLTGLLARLARRLVRGGELRGPLVVAGSHPSPEVR